ncbi:MAG TPA: TlpA disulfide reductase family protein [Tepidiformaceae bacterium]|nr:TlpA disulfide reductase family protein [Tepidiformaceae bacterium]
MTDALPESPAPAPDPQRKLIGYAVLAAAVFIAVLAGAYVFLRPSGDSGKDVETPTGIVNPYPNTGPLDPNRPTEGEKAPDFALVDARDPSKVVKLSDYRGKAVILNWFASWCDPCKNEIPEFQAAQEKLGDQLVVLGVDYLEQPADAVGILDKFGATYPAVLDGAGTVARHYRVTYMPTTFFIDKDGVLRVIKTGEVHDDALVTFLSKVGITYQP